MVINSARMSISDAADGGTGLYRLSLVTLLDELRRMYAYRVQVHGLVALLQAPVTNVTGAEKRLVTDVTATKSIAAQILDLPPFQSACGPAFTASYINLASGLNWDVSL
ncbi:unnamed protein product [Peniophora sp. CBMAI 1063]|nr:unnamed protein product [Peniophora sp. CBMAI 1063]